MRTSDHLAREIVEAEAADAAALTRLPRCACGAPAIAWVPGTEPDRLDIGIVIDAGEPAKAWCSACWDQRFGAPCVLDSHRLGERQMRALTQASASVGFATPLIACAEGVSRRPGSEAGTSIGQPST